MYRIDDPSASATLPTPEAALTEGYWTEGNPGTGTPATLERASWFNMVQEELRAIVVAAAITPSKTVYSQVLTALQSLFASKAETVGIGQTLTNVMPSRALSTLYTNSTGRPIYLYVTATAASTGNAIGGFTAGIEGPISIASAPGALVGVAYLVPAGLTYQVASTGSNTLASWWELR